MPTLSGDTQAVLATDKVRMQGQEVACVIAEDPYVAHDALELIDVDYEPLPVVISPQAALDPTAPLIRDDKEDQTDNKVYHWEAGDAEATEKAFAEADKVVRLVTHYPRCHPAPLECCGCVADVDPATGKATIYMTSQAPHAHRTVFALVAGLPEQNIQIISPDIGGGFGNKVPVYPGYVVATAASLLLGRPVKWIEDRTGNLISTGFARDFYMDGELALTEDGTMTGLRVKMLSDQGYAYADAQPTKFKAGLFHIVTGSYDIPAAHVVTEGAYTNKAPGGVAYRCSFRVTEASFFIERLVQTAAYELGMDPAELRRKNFIAAGQVPVHVGDRLRVRLRRTTSRRSTRRSSGVGYTELREEQKRAREEGRLLGIGLASFTEVVGAGPSRQYDILGIKMFDSAELRVHPTGKAILKLGVKSQGQGHETTFAQIVAHELGIPPEDITVQEGDTDNTPYGLGTYASRSTPVAGAATSVAARKIRDKAKKIAAHLLEAAEDDLEWSDDKFAVRGRARPGEDDPGDRVRRLHRPPRGHGGRARGDELLRPAEHDLSVRDLRRRRRGRPRHRPVGSEEGRRGRRLRHAHQPDDRRGPDHGRPHRGLRDGRDGADHLRRGGQLHRLQLHGLPAADGVGDAAVRARRDGDALAAPPDRREGRRRVGDGRVARGLRERRRRRARARGRAGDRHADDAGQGLGGAERGGPRGMNVLAEAGRLAADGQPFALATVVNVERPASARRGDHALVTPDGVLAGWVGGACTEPTIVREALAALADGEARLVRVEGGCASEGTIEVLVEPQLPAPLLAVIGDGPAAAHARGARAHDRLASLERARG